ncbi:hypothetical protein QJQ45_001199 [Haematococcus lacustris]|nr:hypothetical protein QJQ45_001199 [Haematococcus lacustris]
MQDYTNLLAHGLAKLDKCATVEVCNLVSNGKYDLNSYRHLRCSPGLAQNLLDSFPSLTALTLEGLCVSNDALASLLSHPPLAMQLQRLDLSKTSVPDGDEPGAMATMFQGLHLKQLSIAAIEPGTPPLPSFQPLAQHLTQLTLTIESHLDTNLSFFMEYLQPLAQLQVLTISNLDGLEGLAELLQALPQLHTLQLPDAAVSGNQQLKALLAATQLTSLQLGCFEKLDTSCADAPCSWQRLELTGGITKSAIACLPLHSLSQLVLGYHQIHAQDLPHPEVAAAFHLVAQACKVPVQITGLALSMRSLVHFKVISLVLIQRQREDLAVLVALLETLKCCGEVVVRGLHEVTAADVLALAPLCQDCTHFALWYGSLTPTLEFWHQLVQLMPAVQKVTFYDVRGCVSAAMHESLQLMAEQPWARWLDITLHFRASRPPACWQAGSWLKAGIFKVRMWTK